MSTDSPLIVERRGGIATAWLNRPSVHNALNGALHIALADFWAEVRDDDTVDVAVIGGVEGASFSAGRDLKETAAVYDSGATTTPWEQKGSKVAYPSAITIGKPVVAAIDRYCVGAGLKLATDTDIRIATRRATLGVPQVKVGRGTASPLYLRRAGLTPALVNDMVYTGRLLDAAEALAVGLVSRLVDPPDLHAEAIAVAEAIEAGSRTVVRGAKRGVDAGLADLPPAVADPLWPVVTAMFGATDDAREGAARFAAGHR